MKDYTERNNKAMDEVMITLGLEDKIAIWFCHEVELNPEMTDEQLADLKEMALRDDGWDDEE
jgi:hypothetical protein